MNCIELSLIVIFVVVEENRRSPPPPPDKQLVWQAARATGAAPSYFRPFGDFLDGGLIANNPTLDAMTEIHEYNMALHSVSRKAEIVPVSTVVSLGTGLIPVTELKGIDIFRPESIIDMVKLTQGASAIGRCNFLYSVCFSVFQTLFGCFVGNLFQVTCWLIKQLQPMAVLLTEPGPGVV